MFSKKHGFASNPPVQFRHEAPDGLRYGVVQAAHDHLKYEQIRTCLCRILRSAPDLGNWSEIPNIRDEVLRLVDEAEWYQVYDIIESLVAFIEGTYGYNSAVEFGDAINNLFIDMGAGWQLKAGEGIVIRGDAEFEEAVQGARTGLTTAGFAVAENEIREALHDISKRPAPDLTGAVHHAMGALEASARYIDGSNRSFGDLVSKVGIPRPLDSALEKMWGYSSNYGRHVSPTNVPTVAEATLMVHLSAAFCRFLIDSKK